MNRSRTRNPYGLSVGVMTLLVGASVTPVGAQMQRMGGNPFKPPRASVQYARTRDYDVRHLNVVLDINAAQRSGQGVVTHSLSPLRDNLKTIVFDAGSNLKIETCQLNGGAVSFKHEQNQLTLTPAAPLPRGKEVTVVIRYQMPSGFQSGGANGAGGWHWINPRPEDDAGRPIQGRQRRQGATETPGERPLTIGFWTQGETGGNRFWVPLYDYPNDFCTTQTTVTVPDNWVVIGNGVEGPATRDAAKHTRTFRWTMKQPHATYLLSLAGGELDVQKASWEGVPLYYVVPKGKADLIPGSFEDTPRMLSFFSNALGVKYPWPKYAQNAMYDFGGGMENVSATTLGAGSLSDKRSGVYPMASLNSHELAHQWFGDLVSCESWGDVWLNESFATYFEQLYMEHSRGKDVFDLDRDGSLGAYLGEAQRYQRPVSTKLYAGPDSMFDSHTYPKGGLILHMLRRQLGDTDFYRALNHYLTVNRHKPVDATSLSKAIREAVGVNVEPFFDQWIFKPGHPVLEARWKWDETRKEVVLKVKQTQDTSDGVPIYNTPLTVGLLRNTSSSAVERQTVTLDKAEQEFHLPTGSRPDSVLADPDHDLLKVLVVKPWDEAAPATAEKPQTIGGPRAAPAPSWPDAELPTILRRAPCIVDRLAAIRKYARSEDKLDDAKVQVLAEALRAESGEQAAILLLNRLSGEKRETLRSLYREQAKSAQQGRRAAALEALGKLPATPEDIALLRQAALSDTEQYRVVEVALTALGKLDAANNLDVFKHQINSRTTRDRLSAFAVDVLNEAKLDAVTPALLEATKPERRLFTRTSAVRALAEIGAKDASVQTALLELLKEDKPNLQEAVIKTLKERKAKEAVPALKALATSSKNKDVQTAAKEAAEELEK